jgi:ribonuclease HI
MTSPLEDRDLPRGLAAPPEGPVDVHFDGACEEVGGRRVAAYGFTLEGAGFHHEDYGLAVPPGHSRATNNVAEYVGAICALEWLVRRGYTGEVHVTGDSQLVVRQMKGEYQVRAEHLRPYHERLHQLARSFRTVRFDWVSREQNRRADELSKLGVALGAPSAGKEAGQGPGRTVQNGPNEPSDR